MTSKWDPEKYHDDYREALMDVIEDKIEHGGEAVEHEPKKAPKPTKVIDLVEVLQRSLKESGKTAHGPGRTDSKKRSTSKRAKHTTHRHKKAA